MCAMKIHLLTSHVAAQPIHVVVLMNYVVVLKSAKIGVQVCFCLQIAAIIFCDMQFLERPSLWRVETL